MDDGCFDATNPDKAVAIVEKWIEEHPLVTYADKMREVFPNFEPHCTYTCLAKMLGKPKLEINCEKYGPYSCWNREYGSLENRRTEKRVD